MSGVSYDFSELRTLSADLAVVAKVEVRKSMQQSAIRTKKFWADDARRSFPRSIARRYAPTIDYSDLRMLAADDNTYRVDISPNLKRYGGKTGRGGLIPSLGILEEANKGVRGPARGAINRAQSFAEREFVDRMQLAVDQSLRKRGL